ncbi:hypothetical protein ERO13_D13G180500v2 [Gossypium hirsutum]|uniref:Dormancy-associated protein homolog 3 isoform X1 n=6 Tax=Gossypium TaxID=3633 RepID=A0A1U8HVA9_GOSHI|nr:dormancy-associated protein homolog 3 isoform X1 [Gossypium hirsutum]KAB1996084.1 hypothetical protein ES319_D13G206400v1 [Gossypium barbadense]MBA0668723.1 hypothetical protein [Gossypium klotzschianum]TYG38392.1 hypothetical protein ES288_D13G218900v1 [Gossypium darwinii]TYH35821.1 hypothetical protein ES332_D13G220000v1 [Gossypium tomentosum]TYI47940.1 hypothetical protein E1A91_D13G210700v1 [Gossypium mustelinum]
MGLLDQLWDDTVAGPRPDNGLGKLRKHSTFTFRSNSSKESDGGSVRSYNDETPEETTKVTRTIMIVKSPRYQSGSPPVSPAESTPPVSPFSGGSRESYRFRRRSTSDAYEKGKEGGGRSLAPPYDV